MKFFSVLLSVLTVGGLVAATPTAEEARLKIVTFYKDANFEGDTYTLLTNRLHYCVDFNHGPLIVSSARLFRNTVCDLYTEKGCTPNSYVRTIYEDTPDTGRIEQFSMFCTTVPRV